MKNFWRLTLSAIISLSFIQGAFAASIGETSFLGESSYLSPVFETSGEFTAVISDFKMDFSNDDYVEFKIRFLHEDGLGEWVAIRPDIDGDLSSELNSFLVNANPSHGYQYSVEMSSGKDKVKPSLSNLKFTFIDADSPLSSSEVSSKVGAFQFSNNVNVVSRSSWGADESLNYGETSSGFFDEDEFIDRVVNKLNGEELKWPYEYMKDVKMVVVHHTAGESDLADSRQAVRNIHYYHAVRRGWGDIGYNYIIDKNGVIYEGRGGGEKVVGGHSVAVNKASIGIAVLGNYQTEEVPRAVIESLANLIKEKAETYDLAVNGEAEHNGKYYPVLGGHRDSAATACPGENLYRALPLVRSYIASELIFNEAKLSKDSYAYIDADPLRDITDVIPQKSFTTTIKLKNVGKRSWDRSSTYLALGNKSGLSGRVHVGSSKIYMNESSVATGQTATFTVSVEAGILSGFNGVEFHGVLNGLSRSDLPLYVPIDVGKPKLEFEVEGERIFKVKGSETISVEIKNTGNVTWNLRDEDVSLGLSKTVSGVSVSGLDFNESVEPGDSVKVDLKIDAGSRRGTLNIEPKVLTNFAFDGDPIVVSLNGSSSNTSNSSSGRKELVLTGNVDLSVGETKTYEFELLNNSGSTWNKSNFRVLSLGSRDVSIGNTRLIETSVPNGSTGTIKVDLTAKKSGSNVIQFRFYSNKKLVYTKPFKLTAKAGGSTTSSSASVSSSQSSPVIETVKAASPSGELGPAIRIHLTAFDLASSKVSVSEPVEILLMNTSIGQFDSGDSISVKALDTAVEITVNGKKHITNRARIVPLTDSNVITLVDLENRPGWNLSLNDNKYRGGMDFYRNRDNGRLLAVNELPIELYMRGVGEVSNGTNLEKIKTIMVAARSYAYHYVTDGTKFAGKPYDLDDSPASSQKYIGYGFELRSPNVTRAITETAGKVVTFDGKPIKVAYFTQSDGRTRSAQEVWGWSAPYFVSVQDTYCKETVLLGHGVGISGCGADGMATAGFDHEAIIKYFLSGVGFKSVY